MEEYRVIGKPVKNVDALVKAKGTARYIDDMKLPGMLYGKILRSRYPHAKILRIDLTKARRLAGVKAIITGQDVAQYTYGLAIIDKPIFAVEKVRYLGDEVAGIVAVNRDIAEEATDLIEVDYEELPEVFDPVEAMEEGTILIHERLGDYEHVPIIRPIPHSNICGYSKLRRGDVEEGFREADYIFEDEFKSPAVTHCFMETPGCIANVDSDGSMTVWSSNQGVFSIRDQIAAVLGMPANKVRVIAPYIGGAFGGKVLALTELPCIIMSQIVGKPVKLVYTREEVFVGGFVRQPLISKIKSGVNKDGTIVARKCSLVWNAGAYAGLAPLISRNAGLTVAGPYKIPNVWIDSYSVYTNNTVVGPMRGFGVPQATWASESQIDMIAEKLNIDPLEFRLKNALEEGSILATGQVAHAVGLKECLGSLEEKGDWKKKKAERKKYRGVGIACAHKVTSTPTSSSAFIKLNQDTSVDIIAGAVDLGQGSNTVFSQIVSEELGIPVEKIKVSLPDTSVTPFERGSVSSRITFHMGNAVRKAVEDLKGELFKIASGLLEVGVEDLELKEGRVLIKGSTEEGIPLDKLPMGGRWITAKVGYPAIGKGFFSTAREGAVLDLETGQGIASSVFLMYGAQLVEIEIDPDTGKIKVEKILAAHNVGKVMNPLLLEGQMEGGLSMGLGQALYEELIWREGKTLNPSFTDYKLPSFTDTPKMESIFVEVPHKEGPYGAIGVAELMTCLVPAAIGNAVYDAIGVRIRDLPITPEKILSALKEKSDAI